MKVNSRLLQIISHCRSEKAIAMLIAVCYINGDLTLTEANKLAAENGIARITEYWSNNV